MGKVTGGYSVLPLNPLTPVLDLVADALIKGMELWLPGARRPSEMSPWAFAMWTLATVTGENILCWLFPVQTLVSSRCWAEPWVAEWRQLYGA